jgi:hypothetical protein
MSKKETAVEWVEKQLNLIREKGNVEVEDLIWQHAKQMEKEQIVDAHGVKESYGAEGSRNLWQQTTGEQYYKEQYEREDNKH